MTENKGRGSVFGAMRQNRNEPAPAETPQQEASTAEAPAEAAPLADLVDYAAFGLDVPRARVSRLRVNFSDGSASLFNYAYLTEVLTTSPQFVSLIFTSVIITVQGRNLSGLLDDLQEERVLSLTPFDAKRFNPPDAEKPYITRIERDSIGTRDGGDDSEE